MENAILSVLMLGHTLSQCFMLVIMRHDSLREISVSMLAEARKLSHIGITMMPTRSTLSDANTRRPEAIFESIYRWLYKRLLVSDKNLWPCIPSSIPGGTTEERVTPKRSNSLFFCW